MRKLLIFVLLPAAASLHAIDFFSDVYWNLGYLYCPENFVGFNVGAFGFDFSLNIPIVIGEEDVVYNGMTLGTKTKYNSEFLQLSLTYGIKIFDWFRIPIGVALYGDSFSYSGRGSYNDFEYVFGEGQIEERKYGFNLGVEFLINPFSDNYKLSIRAHTINFMYFFFGVGAAYVFDSYRPDPTPHKPKPKPHPTITPEELRRVELAYAETVRDIERRGKKLYIHNGAERYSFIQRYQGNPNTVQVNMARNTKLPYYSIYQTSQEDIVALAKKEPNEFLKVRMIHDWVADVFAYDYDLLWWMDNVSGRNAEFTLGAIINRQRGVCYEYAILFWFLLDAAGLDVYLISDSSEPGIGHAYNMVVINGTGYIIDTTWDSGNWYSGGRITKFDRMVTKDYFMPDISRSYRLRRW